MAWQALGCATVTEPTEVQSQSLVFFKGAPGSYTAVGWVRTVHTTKWEVRGLTLSGANVITAAQGIAGTSPQATSLGGGGWNVSYTVTTIDDWAEVS